MKRVYIPSIYFFLFIFIIVIFCVLSFFNIASAENLFNTAELVENTIKHTSAEWQAAQGTFIRNKDASQTNGILTYV